MPVVVTTMPFRTSGCPLLPQQCLSGRPDARFCHDNAFPDVHMPVVATTMPFRTSGCPFLSRQPLSGRPDARFWHDNPFPEARIPVFVRTMPSETLRSPFLKQSTLEARSDCSQIWSEARAQRLDTVTSNQSAPARAAEAPLETNGSRPPAGALLKMGAGVQKFRSCLPTHLATFE